ncbi:uncharacterized protein BDV17DRAFT_3439 [Aspergillus undulatus]|uniref:uncharacterized protein n=1 Tax=Aspergillus undulatus TaxID=1810928 RepID=UPI003CCE05C1
MYKRTFDSIYSLVHPKQQRYFGSTLVEIFLNKTVIDAFFRHPFWYVEEEVHPSDNDDDVPWDKMLLLGKKLEMLHSQFSNSLVIVLVILELVAWLPTSIPVYSEYAQVRRTITTCLYNLTVFIMARPVDLHFGEAMKGHRDAEYKAMAVDLLKNEIFLSPLQTDR